MNLIKILNKCDGQIHTIFCSKEFGAINVYIDNESYQYCNGKAFDDYILPIDYNKP